MSTEGGTPGGGPDKRQRKHSPLAVASVAAAVLLAGRGRRGVLGVHRRARRRRRGAPGASGASGTPAPLALDGYPSGTAGGGASQGIAPGEPDPRGVRYRASGSLPDGPRTAPVHLPGSEVSGAEVAALAKALDVRGTPRLVKDTWTVGGGPDAAGPTLQVSRQGPGDWAYSKYGVPGGTSCAHPPGGGPKEQGSSGASPGLDSPAPACPSFRDGSPGTDPAAAGPVSEEKAKSVVAPVFKALGQDGAKVGATAVHGAVRTVTADPVVNSTPTYGWQTSLQVGADAQVVGGSGRLQTPKKGAAYPLTTARKALEELNRGAGTGRVAVGGCATAVPFRDGDGAGDAPCEGKRDGREPVTVTGAVFGLSAQSVSGRQALVPSWLFTAKMPGADDKADTVTIAQPAIDPKFVAKAPSTRPGGPSATAPASSSPVRVDAYTTEDDGKKLVLHFWGGVCSTYAASVEQSSSAATVKITGTEKEPGRACVMIAKRMETTVTLDEPLGDRKVVDVSNGETVRERQGK
ncbi:hypothetical protein J1792_29125 [Streptomyces triculaminicus]|uniref:Large membrane protein n=1 Tax=Streptomyces triculaminicus TaxID=2816232 RepID=A0A939FTY1_9ACTN|nr:hypothetical protein [Streptomyces triculaminicus]MBO0656658.1 hypothetical protein [Streptomyces triculaminicus]